MKKLKAALCYIGCLTLCAACFLPKFVSPQAKSGYVLTASAFYENTDAGDNAGEYVEENEFADNTIYKVNISKVTLTRKETDEITGKSNTIDYTTWDSGNDTEAAIYKIEVKFKSGTSEKTALTEYRVGYSLIENSVLNYVAYQEVKIPKIQSELLAEKKIEVTEDDHITVIPDKVFLGSYIKSIDLNNIAYIGNYAFQDCQYITEVEIPSCVKYIGTGAFKGSGLKTLNVNNAMVRIPDEFCTETKLTKITFAHPEYIRFVGKAAFKSIPTATAFFENWSSKKVAGYETMTIGESAFEDCTTIETLTLPDNVGILYPKAFKGCTKLNTLTLGKNVIGMDKESFADCTALDTINFNSNLESLGGSCFAGCTSLKTVDMSKLDNLEDWVAYTSTTGWGFGNYMFQNCTALTKCYLPKNITIVPEGVFAGCTALNWVNTDYNKDNITKIGDDAFKNCIHLLDADYPIVEEIGASAFEGCTELQNAKYPKCTIIRRKAFSGCSALTSFKVAHCTEVGSYALEGCSKLDSIVLEADKYGYDYEENTKKYTCNGYVFKDCTAAKSITITCDTTNLLTKGMFYGCTSLTEVKSDLSPIEIIGESAFEKCSALEKITFANLRIIEKNAFANCEKLKSIGIKAIKAEDYGNKCFYNCSALKVEVSGEISTIGISAFDNSGITKVDVNGMVGGTIVIGNNAFSNCQNLASASIISPDGNVYSVGTGVFKNCPILASAVFAGPIITNEMFMDCPVLASVQTDATTINKSAFENCAALKLVTDRVETKKTLIAKDLGEKAFAGCTSLTAAPTNGDTNITGTKQFLNCSSIKEATVGMLTTEMFSGCSSLTKVEYPRTTEIPAGCFRDCAKFAGVDLKDLLTINQYAFAGTAFKEVAIENAQTIGKGAFQGCQALAKVDVSAAAIADEAFSNCPALTTAYVTAETLGSKVFYNDPMLVNAEIKDTDTRKIQKIGANAFDSCTALRTLIVNGEPTNIGAKAFGYNGTKVNEDFLVVGITGSGIQTFADKNKIAFADISTYDPAARDVKATPGDVDGNGVVAVADAVKLSKYLVGTETAINAENSDLNGDKKINAVDLSLLKRKILSRSSK